MTSNKYCVGPKNAVFWELDHVALVTWCNIPEDSPHLMSID
jgi:hypothetical protein